MSVTRRLVVAVVAVMTMSAATFAQVTAQLPAQTLVALRVKNMQDLSQKIAALGVQIGITPEQAPPVADLLGFISKQGKIEAGLKKDGDFAVFLLNNLQAMNGPKPPVVMLIPVSDYQAFLGNFADAKTDGAISTVTLADGETGYVAKWGDYAALSPTKDMVAGQPGGMVITPTAAKEMDKDACVIVNMPAVRALAVPLIMVGRQQAIIQMDRGLRQSPLAKYAGIMKVGVNEMIDYALKLLTNCDDITLSYSLAPEGISTSFVADFKPDSSTGQYLAATKNTDQTLLAGLAGGKYLAFGGGIADSKRGGEFISAITDPLQPELDKLGPDGKPISDVIQCIKDMVGATTSASFGMVAPEGELGTSPLLQFVAVRNGDAKTFAAANARLQTMQQNQFKGMGGAMPMQMSFTPAAKTVDGIVFDQYHQGFDMAAAQGPQMAQIGQIMSFVYSQDGMNIYSGVVNDTTFLQVGGLPDEKISAAIAAAKSGEDALGKDAGVVATAAQLPKQRLSAFYVPLDVLVNTAFGYVAKFGLDMGVTMPAAEPIGMTISTDASAIRTDTYISSKTMTGIVEVVTKLKGKAQRPGGPGGGL